MKIYPSNHEISFTNESRIDTDLNIPLAFVNIDNLEPQINIQIHKDFLQSKNGKNLMTPIIPKQHVTEEQLDSYFFDERQQRTNTIHDLWYYDPTTNKTLFKSQYEFDPYKFKYKAIIRKCMAYKSSRRYNMNIACIDDADSLDLSNRLSKVLVNPSARGYIPMNVAINNNSMEPTALIDMDYINADFVFLETINGKVLDKITQEPANISSFLDDHINVWVGCDYYDEFKTAMNISLGPETMTITGSFKEFELAHPILTTKKYVTSDVYFNLDYSVFKKPGVNIYNMFNGNLAPIVIVEHIGKGFEIISHNSILKDPVKHKDLIYEALMYVHLMSYKGTNEIKEWITYDVPDYEVVNNALYKKSSFISSRSLNEYFNLAPEDYNIYQVNLYDDNTTLPISQDDLTSGPNIECIDIVNGRLKFEMKKPGINEICTYSEDVKPDGWISIYSDGKIYYMDQLYYMMECDISNQVFINKIDNNLHIKIYPSIKSTAKSLDIYRDLELIIPNIEETINGQTKAIDATYYIYYDSIEDRIYYDTNERNENNSSIYFFAVEVKQLYDSTNIIDMRQLGGGLVEDVLDDYDLLDIGHVNGRPYRKSNTLIVKMPKKYEQYKDQILKALDKYRVGEDYPIIFFEDEE